MVTNNVQFEMQEILKNFLKEHSFDVLTQGLVVYEQTYGKDSFYTEMIDSYIIDEPLISLICLNASDEEVDTFLSTQNYLNIEIVRVTGNDSWQDIYDYFTNTTSSYVCFLEPRQFFAPTFLPKMVNYLSTTNVDMVISARNFINDTGTIIAHPDSMYQNSLKDRVFNGKPFFELCISEGVNIFGILSTCMLSTSHALKTIAHLPNCEYEEIIKFAMLSQFIIQGTVGYIDTALVSTQVYDYRDESHLQKCFEQYIADLNNRGLISLDEGIFQPTPVIDYSNIDKHITFFYTDKGEYYNLKPIADEAEKRGYQVVFTENILQKAEIGVYCQHTCFPENSKFSLILLHDMTQTSSLWPNIWERERWNKFDIGILPGKEWGKRWQESACQYYANPRLGTYTFGYPKSDIVKSLDVTKRANELRNQFKLKYDFSVLYAPSWENDEKEDDFVRALVSLPINLLIKQAHWPITYPHIIENIEQMRLLHEGKYDNVYYIEPEESILTALELCDIVVSDESSVMTEAILFQKPSIAVSDWLIPDTTPSHFASFSMDYVLKCKKVELREYIEKLSSQTHFYEEAKKLFTDVFSNQGHCCEDILNAIEYYTQSETNSSFMEKKLFSKYTICSMWN